MRGGKRFLNGISQGMLRTRLEFLGFSRMEIDQGAVDVFYGIRRVQL